MIDIIDDKDVMKIGREIVGDVMKIGDVMCCICEGKETGLRKDGSQHWLKYYDEKGNWDKKSRMCTYCYMDIYKSSSDSQQYFRKSQAKSRIGNFNRFEMPGKAVIGQWIGGKTLGLKDLNIEKNNFREPIDLSTHSIYGSIDVKIATYNHINDQWRFGGIRHNFDNLLALCMDRYELWRDVDCVYMIPIAYISVENITITKNLSPRRSKWEKFRIDEKPYNDTYHSADIPEFFNPWDVWKGKYDIKKEI